jgi:hypothetical protein
MLPLLSLERPLACGVVAGREVLPHSAQQQRPQASSGVRSVKKVGRLENRVVRGTTGTLIEYMYVYVYVP